MRHIQPISGKDSLATALFQRAYEPDRPYEYFFNDTGTELPETYAWLNQVETTTAWEIKRVGLNLQDLIDKRGGFLPSAIARYCTRETKIEPMEAMLGAEEATVYYGLRNDENRTGYLAIGKPNIHPVYPLQTFGIDLGGVYAILEAQGLMPPDFFWPRLFEAVSKALSDNPRWQSLLSQTERRILFAGRSRGNCYFCFYQRRYEFVWLLETHPEMFWKAAGMEKEKYFWVRDFPLRDLPGARAEALFEKRVKDVVRYIKSKMQGLLISLEVDTEIAFTSCGLLCGK